MTAHFRNYLLLVSAIACMTIMPAHAAIDVSLDREVLELQELERLIEDIESVETEKELRPILERWNRLRNEMQERRRMPEVPPSAEKEIRNIERELAQIGTELSRVREEILRYFPKARNRIAVFTFDHSTDTELGDALSFIVSKHMLFSTRVQSFAVVNFQEGTAPSSRGEVAYFEKVDKLTRGQDYSVAVWGRVTRARRGLKIDTFGQAYPDPTINRFAVDVRLPEAMGGKSLSAGLVHDRFQLDSISIENDDADEFKLVAQSIRKLRKTASRDAEVIGRLTEDKPYYVAESDGDWVRLQVRGGGTGWTSVRAFCTDACARFLAAVDFANEIVAAGGGVRPRPPARELNDDTRYVYREAAALHALVSDADKAAELSGGYADLGFRGVGLANIHSVARIAGTLRTLPAAEFDTYRLETEFLQETTRDFQQALTFSPSEKYTQENLQTLLEYSGDANTAQRFNFRSFRKAAVIIQVGDYEQLPALANTGAARLAKALDSAGYEVTLTVDGTRAGIVEALSNLEPTNASASLLLYFSGHTIFQDERVYLMPVDANPDGAAETGLEIGRLVQLYRPTLLLLDTAMPEALFASLRTRLENLDVDALVSLSVAEVDRSDAGLFPYFLGNGIAGAADVDSDGFIDMKELELFLVDEARRNGFQMNLQAVSRSGDVTNIVSAPVYGRLER